MSEPEAGSDVGALKTRAVRENGEYVLNGSKMWISYAREASHVLIVCRTQEGSTKHEGLSMIFVPRDAEGMTMTPIETLGGDDTNEIYLDNVRVPAEYLLGEDGNGWLQLMAGLNKERVILAAQALGPRAARVRRRARLREGAQAVRAPDRQLPGAAAPLRAARDRADAGAPPGAPRRAADRRGPGADAAEGGVDGEARRAPSSRRSARSRGCSRWAGTATRPSTRWRRYLRAAVVTTIFGGTSEIQKNIIAKTLGL